MHPIAPRHLLCAALLCLATLTQAQVTPPMRADVKLNGNDAGGRSNGTLATCHDLCKSTPGCSGFSFAAPVAGSKPLCWLFSGSLTEAARAGVVSCRMPCTPAPRASVLPQRQPVAKLRDPAAPTLSVPARLMPPPPAPASAPKSEPKR